MAAPSDSRADDYRERLLAGLAAAIVDVGYSGLRIEDVVRHARVSKRTFYEHFAGKEECLLALYEAECDRVLANVEAALRASPVGEARVEAGTAVYLSTLQAQPGLVRTLLVEILHVGERGLAVRRKVIRRFADLLLREMDAAGVRTAVSPVIATALVGGINELILAAVEEDRADRLVELGPAVAALVRSFLVPRAAVAPAVAARRSATRRTARGRS